MKNFIALVLLLLISPLCYSQTDIEIKSNINIEVDSNSADSTKRKITLATELIDFQAILSLLFTEINTNRPESIKSEDFNEALPDLIQNISSKYLEVEGNELFSSMIGNYVDNFSEQELIDLVAYYKTPLGDKVKRLENQKLAIVVESSRVFGQVTTDIFQEMFPKGKKRKKKGK